MINWKIRLKNPVFLIQTALSVLMPVLTYMGLSACDITSWSILGNVLLEAVKNPYVCAGAAVSIWNAVNDPTTWGTGDSLLAKSYEIPKKDTQ